jgi:glycosyltransferase involved in cell wall biosynthesis
MSRLSSVTKKGDGRRCIETSVPNVTSRRRVLLLNRFFYPDQSPTSELLSDLAFALSDRNFQVTAITSRLRYDDRDARLCPCETVRGVEIRRIWSFRSRRDDLIGRGLEYLSFYLSAGLCLWRVARAGDVIVSKTDPPLLSILAAPIARIRGALLINWLQDLFPEVAERLEVTGAAAQPVFRQLQRLRNRSLRSAAMNVVPGTGMAKTLEQEGIAPERIQVIPNWSDGQLIKPVASEANELRARWGLAPLLVVAYAGNFGRAHEFETIIQTMTLHQQRARLAPADDIMHRIVFLLVGGGPQREKLEQEIAVRELKNVRLHPYQPRDCLAEVLGAADIHLISLRPELEGLMVPSKFYGITAAARPAIFIGSTQGEIAQLIEETKCGITVETGDSEALLACIVDLAKNPALIRAIGARARSAFEAQWDKRHALAKWQTVIDTASHDAASHTVPDARDK